LNGNRHLVMIGCGSVQLQHVFRVLIQGKVESTEVGTWQAGTASDGDESKPGRSVHCIQRAYLVYRTLFNETVFSPCLVKCIHCFPSVLWRCWSGDRKGIQPVKNLALAKNGIVPPDLLLKDWRNTKLCHNMQDT